MDTGRTHFNVLAISQETAEKPFRDGTSANVSCANKKDALHKLRPRDYCAIDG
jgi:hypothetical protein